MDLINQIMCQQIIPKGFAAGYHNRFALLAFEFGKLLICVSALDDADILPISLQRILDDDALDGLARLRQIAL